MPMASDDVLDPRLKILAYGREKSKKSWWCARAAEAGFNVVFINGEHGGTQIINNVPKEARERILICNVADTVDRPVFASFSAQFLKPGNNFTWDEQKQQSVPGLRDITHSFIEFDASKLTLNDVLVFDSWTTLSQSASHSYAIDHNIDVTDAEKTEWDGYGFEGRFLDFILAKLKALPCHVFVTAHAYTYEKWNDKKGPERKMLWSREQPISSSGPHGGKVPTAFNDVLFFDRVSSEYFTIDTGGSKNSVGGSRLFPPYVHKWAELPPAEFFKKVGCKPTGAPCLGARWIAPGTEQILGARKVVIPALSPKPDETPIIGVGSGAVSLRDRLKMKGG